ncbi:MAG TPA: SHOCT domain-containing protein [Actinomycetota bacterium]
MMWGPDNGWWWIGGILMMLVFWGGLAALVVYSIREWGRRGPSGAPGRPYRSDARAILEERYARGEISKEEFEERRRVLDSTS